MKNVLFLFLTAGLMFLAACEKEVKPEVTPEISEQPKEISVDYAIYAASGNVKVVALVPENGVLVEKTFEISRMNQTISFKTMSHQEIMVKATNSTPSHEEVMVTIFVDGFLFKSNSTTTANGWAMAKGIPQ